MAERQPRRPLSRARIAAAALRLVDREGLAALSMRRLGAALDCEAMSLYKHVAHKDELLDLVAERVLAEIAVPPTDGHWEARLRSIARELRAAALAHPHALPLVATRVPAAPAACGLLDATLAALRTAGLDDDAAVSAFWAFVAYTTGALLSECAALTGVGSSTLTVPNDLDGATFPDLEQMRARLAGCDFATEYDRGLDLLIGAIRAG